MTGPHQDQDDRIEIEKALLGLVLIVALILGALFR